MPSRIETPLITSYMQQNSVCVGGGVGVGMDGEEASTLLGIGRYRRRWGYVNDL